MTRKETKELYQSEASITDIAWQRNRQTKERLGVSTPPYNPGRLLTAEEIDAIYLDAEIGRWSPEFIYDENGQEIGYRRSSIDAWCE